MSETQNKFAVHFNYNMVAVIDVETTGLNARLHDIWQVCILALDSQFRPYKGMVPFEILLKPRRLENYDRNNSYLDHKGIQKACLEGHDYFKAADLFHEWYQKLGLMPKKRIIPLGQNYSFDKSFILDWLGVESYELYFDYHNRDTMAAALFLNDRADAVNQSPPYPHVSLNKLCQSLKVKNERPHDALYDCIATAEVYRKMVLAGGVGLA